ncbi:MAG: TetR/AcrR family transcriptional regulator [Spirochaetales bacterium]|nr:TetR/AcrR family transcriptional regulator [Spirochaetales bacterium]
MNITEQLKDQRLKKTIEAAQILFSKQGIEKTSIQEIADLAEIGVASVYRYYDNKTNIAVAAAIDIWKKWNNMISKVKPKGNNGLEKIENLIDSSLFFFKSNPAFLNFVDNFDNYIANLPEMPERMQEYENTIYRHRPIVYSIIAEGLSDGSINRELPIKEIINTTIHALLTLAQKLYLRGNIIPNDRNIRPEIELEILKKMVIKYISNK